VGRRRCGEHADLERFIKLQVGCRVSVQVPGTQYLQKRTTPCRGRLAVLAAGSGQTSGEAPIKHN